MLYGYDVNQLLTLTLLDRGPHLAILLCLIARWVFVTHIPYETAEHELSKASASHYFLRWMVREIISVEVISKSMSPIQFCIHVTLILLCIISDNLLSSLHIKINRVSCWFQWCIAFLCMISGSRVTWSWNHIQFLYFLQPPHYPKNNLIILESVFGSLFAIKPGQMLKCNFGALVSNIEEFHAAMCLFHPLSSLYNTIWTK